MLSIESENTTEMITQKTLPLLSTGTLTAWQLNQFFNTLKRLQFNGQVVLKTPRGQQCFFYLHLGWIMYATGGIHVVRRWRRNLATYCPNILSDAHALQVELPSTEQGNFTTCWEEHLLSLWVAQQKVTREQAANITQSVVSEVLFDVLRAKSIDYQTKPDKLLSTQLILIDPEEVFAEVQPMSQLWKNAKLSDYSPDTSPLIKQPEKLQKGVSPSVYQALYNLLNGQYTLYDLGTQMKRDIVQVTRPLLPYIQSGWVELINIPDFPIPVKVSVPKTSSQRTAKEPLIACIDDSILICQTMEKLLTSVGYQFFSVTDDLRALATLLARKPDLIFLDLVMPNTNGYEICTQLRKLSMFRNTPIVILTGNDGIVDQVRARLVGASDFLNKPIDSDIVLNVINKHLRQNSHIQ
jgi:chemotaxis family two-component system response regulator PixG